jgi:hypothetical protein
LKEVLNRFELTDSCLLGITTDNASSNYLITWELQSTLDTSGIVWPAMRNQIPCIAHIYLLDLGTFRPSLRINGGTKSCKAHECDQQFGENKITDIWKRQRLGKEGNARTNKVSAMRLDLAKILE